MTPVFGENAYVELLITGVYYPVFCADDCVFKEQTEIVEASTITSSIFKEWRPRMKQWSFDVSGLTKIDNTDGPLSYFWLLGASIAMTPQTIRATYIDKEGHTYQIGGTCYIQTSSINSAITDWSEASVTFIGTGGLNTGTIAPPVVAGTLIKSDWWNTVNGNAFINGASTGNTDGTTYTLVNTDAVKLVAVEGIVYDIVPGAPGNRQCQLDLVNNKIKVQNAFDGTQHVFVAWER